MLVQFKPVSESLNELYINTDGIVAVTNVKGCTYIDTGKTKYAVQESTSDVLMEVLRAGGWGTTF